MKTKLLLGLALLFATSVAFSQSLVLSHDGETLEPNAELSVEGEATAAEIVIELAVTNTSGASMDVLCQRYEIDIVEETTNAFCWAGLCYPPWTGLSAFHTTIGAGVTIDDDFSGHYYPAGYGGISTIAYTFYDMNNPNDSVQVTIMYNGLTVGIGEIEKYKNAQVFPNPANNYVKLNLNTNQTDGKVNFQLLDVTGTLVREIESNSTEIKINTSDLAEGVYMYRAIVNERIIKSDKLIIQH